MCATKNKATQSKKITRRTAAANKITTNNKNKTCDFILFIRANEIRCETKRHDRHILFVRAKTLTKEIQKRNKLIFHSFFFFTSTIVTTATLSLNRHEQHQLKVEIKQRF